MLNSLSLIAAVLPLALSAPADQAAASPCRNVKFTVNGSAQNHNITGLDFSNYQQIEALASQDTLGQVPISGPQTLAGIYCPPTVNNANKDKLQVLFHGITSNREYWTAQGGSLGDGDPYRPDLYSWVNYAVAQGYPVLAVDRLGNGASSHPDPVLVVQGPYEQALYNDLATQIRAGSTGALPQAYSFLIYVGHSYGSELGNAIAQLYPKAYDEFVLTGFSMSVDPSLPGVSLQAPAPAAIVDPARFGTLDPGYVTSTMQQSRTNSFFGTRPNIDYDQQNANLFFQRKDTVSLGQFFSTYVGTIMDAPNFTGRVLVLTGENDQAFCGPGSSAIGPASCGPLLANTKSLFPNAQYNFHSVANTGHVVNLHYSAPSSFVLAHQFLAGRSFSG